MDILPSGNIFRELQDIHDTGFFSAQTSLEDHWQQSIGVSQNLDFKLKSFQIVNEEPTNDVNMNGLKLTKYNRTIFLVNGIVVLNLSPEMQAQAEISVVLNQKKSNGYQESSLVQFKKVNYCNFINQTWVRSRVEHFYSFTNFTETRCPFTPGTYFIKDFYPDLSNAPPLPNGEYRMDIHFLLNDAIMNGVLVVFSIEYL